MPRWHLSCDACEETAWIGRERDHVQAWCEACHASPVLEAGAESAACPSCGAPLAVTNPRFPELWGELQNLSAVLAAWIGDTAPLAAILPERPRFLTDRTPPEPWPDDPPAVRDALGLVASGAFASGRAALAAILASEPGVAHAWRALAIAAERTGTPSLAEVACGRALTLLRPGGNERMAHALRLERGALRARRGDRAGAREDFDAAGDGREARWNRAALAVIDSVVTGDGVPPAPVIAGARAEAGEPSPYWSEPTIGRLLFALLVERAIARQKTANPVASGVAAGPDSAGIGDASADAQALRTAEALLEFDTFWDRALVLHGYAALNLRDDARRISAALARDVVEEIATEPCLRGPAAGAIAEGIARARAAVGAGDPERAMAALAPLTERADLRHFRIPCAHCGRGSVGVDEVAEDQGEE
jgi:hypothetical protein